MKKPSTCHTAQPRTLDSRWVLATKQHGAPLQIRPMPSFASDVYKTQARQRAKRRHDLISRASQALRMGHLTRSR